MVIKLFRPGDVVYSNINKILHDSLEQANNKEYNVRPAVRIVNAKTLMLVVDDERSEMVAVLCDKGFGFVYTTALKNIVGSIK